MLNEVDQIVMAENIPKINKPVEFIFLEKISICWRSLIGRFDIIVMPRTDKWSLKCEPQFKAATLNGKNERKMETEKDRKRERKKDGKREEI